MWKQWDIVRVELKNTNPVRLFWITVAWGIHKRTHTPDGDLLPHDL